MLMSRNAPSPNLPVGLTGRCGGVFVFRVPPARVSELFDPFDLGPENPEARAGAVPYFAIQ